MDWCYEAIQNHYRTYQCLNAKAEHQTPNSSTFLVKDPQERTVTLKVMTLNDQSLNELANLHLLKGKSYIVQLLEHHKDSKYIFEVLDFGNRMSLEEILEHISDLGKLENVVSFGFKIAKGLFEIHSAFLSHGDLTPQNIVMDLGFKPLITNFESSVMTGSNEIPTGSIDYLAPELLDGRLKGMSVMAEDSADIFSFGLILYFVRYRKLPLPKAESTHDLLESFVVFPPNEEDDFIELVRMCLVHRDVRSTLPDIIAKLELIHNRFQDQKFVSNKQFSSVKFKVLTGELESLNIQINLKRLIVFTLGSITFFVILFVFICNVCLYKDPDSHKQN